MSEKGTPIDNDPKPEETEESLKKEQRALEVSLAVTRSGVLRGIDDAIRNARHYIDKAGDLTEVREKLTRFDGQPAVEIDTTVVDNNILRAEIIQLWLEISEQEAVRASRMLKYIALVDSAIKQGIPIAGIFNEAPITPESET